MFVFQVIKQPLVETPKIEKLKGREELQIAAPDQKIQKGYLGLSVIEHEYETINAMINAFPKREADLLKNAYDLGIIKKEYTDLIDSIVKILSSKGLTAPKTKEDTIDLVAETCSLIYSTFDAVPEGTGLLLFALRPIQRIADKTYPDKTIDCDISALVVHDVIKEFGVNSKFVIVQSKGGIEMHVVLEVPVLKMGNVYFETTTGQNGIEDLIFYPEQMFKEEYKVNYGAFDSFDVLTYTNKALVEMDFGLNKIGIKDIDKAIKMVPEYGSAYIIRAHLNYQLDNFLGGLADLDIGLKINDMDPDGHNLKGVLLCSLMRYEDGIREFERAMKMAPRGSKMYEDAKVNLQYAKMGIMEE